MNLFQRLWRAVRPATPPARPRQRGSVAVMTAITAVVILGIVGLGVEVTNMLLQRQKMQAAADGAAMAGAEAAAGGNVRGLAIDALAVAARDGFVSGVNQAVVTVNNPPKSGSQMGNSGAVEAIIGQPQTLPLSGLLYHGAWMVNARGVAAVGNSASDCVLALDPANATGVWIGNGAQVNLNNCGLADDATGSSALLVTGGAHIWASGVSVGGSANVNNGGAITVTGAVKTSQSPPANPYASVQIPASSGCAHGSAGHPLTLGWSSGTQTLNADGVYCGGLVIGNAAVVAMNPGVYIINGGSFQIGGGITLVATGVTIVLTGSGSNFATANIGNGTTVKLTAPATGATAGLVFFQDPNAPKTGTNNFQGGATLVLTGALYFPSQMVTFSNGSSSNAACTQLVAWQVTFTGGAAFNSSCTGVGVSPIGASLSKLVE